MAPTTRSATAAASAPTSRTAKPAASQSTPAAASARTSRKAKPAASHSTPAAASAAAPEEPQRTVEIPMSSWEKSKATALLEAINKSEEAISTLESREERIRFHMLPDIYQGQREITRRFGEAEKMVMLAKWTNEGSSRAERDNARYELRKEHDALQVNMHMEIGACAELEQVLRELKEARKWRQQLHLTSVCLMETYPVNGIRNFGQWVSLKTAT